MADDDVTPRIISGKEAALLGLPRYFTGNPCKRGHYSERVTANGTCIECQRNAQMECARRKGVKPRGWKYADPERRRLRREDKRRYHQQYREKHRERLVKYAADRYRNNLDAERKKRAEYYKSNPERTKEKARAYYAANREYVRVRVKQYATDNQDQVRVWHRNRKKRIKKNGGRHTLEDIQELFVAQRGCCAYCRTKIIDEYHVDHIMPIARGGTNDKRNLQILCIPCNLAKNDRDPIDHARTIGLLL